MPFAYQDQPFPMYLVGILLCSGAVVFVGAMDDLHQYKAKVQAGCLLALGLIVQLFVTKTGTGHDISVQIAGLKLGDNWVNLGWWAYPLTAIYIFVVSKTMDTIDGIDGLAAGIAAIAATTLSIVATLFVLNYQHIEKSAYVELPRVALISAAIAGAALGFLRYNYNPAKIFMGTGGAQLFGFMLAAISIVGVLKTAAAFTLVIPMLAFGIPMFDAVFVITRRIASRQPITQADKRHLHHTLLGKGLSQKQAVWVLYLAAMMLCVVILVVVRKHG
jgi:UDP-GlcNAc:undecaprenyl-phosphate GlcNAc-1-phosphate transferase